MFKGDKSEQKGTFTSTRPQFTSSFQSKLVKIAPVCLLKGLGFKTTDLFLRNYRNLNSGVRKLWTLLLLLFFYSP